jgi:large conductance mechanosensitive channel
MAKIDKEKLAAVTGKGKGFIEEFKAFVLKGNVMDMAVGVIIGSAFASIVTALTDDFINPLINGIGGAEVAGKIKIYGGQYLNWGHFVTSVINFLIMAFVLFLMLKFVNKLLAIGKKKEAEEVKETKSAELVVLEEILKEVKKK